MGSWRFGEDGGSLEPIPLAAFDEDAEISGAWLMETIMNTKVLGGPLSKPMGFAAMWVMQIFIFGFIVEFVGVPCCLDAYIGDMAGRGAA